jgi:hypothetical protein
MIEIACDGDKKKLVLSENDQQGYSSSIISTHSLCAQTKYTHNIKMLSFSLAGCNNGVAHSLSGVCRDSNSAPVVDFAQARRLFMLHTEQVCVLFKWRAYKQSPLHAV